MRNSDSEHRLRETERRLRDSESKLRSIVDSNLLGMLFWNRDGAITEANDALLSMVGYSREDLAAGRANWLAMTPLEFRHLDEQGLKEIAERGVCTPFEKEYIHKDGTRVPVLIGGASHGENADEGVAFVLNLSEHKRHERQRGEADFRLRSVVDNAPIVLWSIDKDGIFTLSEGRGLGALGLGPGQVVGGSAFALYEKSPQVVAHLRRGLAGEEFTGTAEVNGRIFETLNRPLKNASGEVNGLLGISMDITERYQAERERESLQIQLLQIQKLESLGLLAGGVAHDFNNILTAILGSASTALLALPSGNPARGDIENVVAAARRAADLTRQMLAYSGKGHFEITAIDLSRLVRELATLLETMISRKVQLRLDLASELPAIEADVAQAQQVIMNLVINGAEAIGEQRGTVRIATGVQDIDEHYSRSLLAPGVGPGRFVYVEVSDTGCGMDESLIARIFDPFFTTKFTGRGLGLAAVLGIVRALHCAIHVDSAPGKGTTFKVFFPASVRVTEKPVARESHFRGVGTALIIDDDENVRRATRRMLEAFGYEVVDAADGREGVRAFEARPAGIAVILLDMTMPEMSGEEALREIRRVSESVPVVLTSGYDETDITRRLEALGLASFMKKPFSLSDLAMRLAAVTRKLPPS